MSGFDIRLFMLSGTGVLICLAGVYILTKKPTVRILAVTWSFGGVFLVGGVFGLEGIREFSQFVSVVKPLLTNPSEQTYANAFKRVGEGSLSPEIVEATEAITTARPIPDMAAIVETEAARARDSSGRATLTVLERSVKAQDSVASHLANELTAGGVIDVRSFQQLDRTSQVLVARKVLGDSVRLTPDLRQTFQEASRIRSATVRRQN